MIEVLIGSVSGIFSGIGMGGGTILIFLLSIIMGLEQHTAQATNLIYFVPTAISAIIVNYREKIIDTKLAKIISFYGIIGSILGTLISINTDVQKLRKIYGVFLLLMAIHEIYTLYKEYKNCRNRNTKSS